MTTSFTCRDTRLFAGTRSTRINQHDRIGRDVARRGGHQHLVDQVGRRTALGEALMILSVDEPIPPLVVRSTLPQAASISSIKVIKL